MNTSSDPSPPSTTPTVLVAVADGSEEIESVCIIDTLRRADIHVVVAKVSAEDTNETQQNDLHIKASRGVNIVADVHLNRVKHQEFDMIVLPGGLPGAKLFASNDTLIGMLRHQKKRMDEKMGRDNCSCKIFLAAICASPAIVFAPNGILDGVSHVTCYPALKEQLLSSLTTSTSSDNNSGDSAQICFVMDDHHGERKTVVSRNVITSQGPGTSLDFALNLIARLVGEDRACTVAKQMLIDHFVPVKDH